MWHSDSNIEKRQPNISFVKALEHEAKRSGIYTLESFDKYQGFDETFIKACEHAARCAFQHRFMGFRYGGPKPFIKMHDARKVIVHGQLHIEYGGILDFLNDAGTFNQVFDTFIRSLREYLHASYPDVQVGMSHSGHYKRVAIFNVKVALVSDFCYA